MQGSGVGVYDSGFGVLGLVFLCCVGDALQSYSRHKWCWEMMGV